MAPEQGLLVPFYPGLTGLWSVKMHHVIHKMLGKRVANRHPNRIFPEAQKGQKLSASWGFG